MDRVDRGREDLSDMEIGIFLDEKKTVQCKKKLILTMSSKPLPNACKL